MPLVLVLLNSFVVTVRFDMLMSRKDVRINNRNCPHSSFLGFSSSILKCGDFFTYYEDGIGHVRLAKMLHQIEYDSLCNCTWIVAQVASPCMSFTVERWINPTEVHQVIPAARMSTHIREHFIECEMQQPVY